jgi:hypothetical protein
MTMKVSPGTPLYEAWLPKRKKQEPDGSYLVHLDPVEFQAMMASAGSFYTLDQTIASIQKLQEQSNTQGEMSEQIPEENWDNPEGESSPVDTGIENDLDLP